LHKIKLQQGNQSQSGTGNAHAVDDQRAAKPFAATGKGLADVHRQPQQGECQG
jgi:hypothetical protein